MVVLSNSNDRGEKNNAIVFSFSSENSSISTDSFRLIPFDVFRRLPMLSRALILLPLMEGCRDLKELISTLATVRPHFRACQTWQPLLLSHFGCRAPGHQRPGCKNIWRGNHLARQTIYASYETLLSVFSTS